MKCRVSDIMYKHNDHYLKLYIPQCSIVFTIQKVCRLEFLQVPQGRCGKNPIMIQKRWLNFQNEH